MIPELFKLLTNDLQKLTPPLVATKIPEASSLITCMPAGIWKLSAIFKKKKILKSLT